MVGIVAGWQDPTRDKEMIAALRGMWAGLDPLTGGYYGNLREETESLTVSNYGPALERLVALKDAYDPGNLFRLNANIKPSG